MRQIDLQMAQVAVTSAGTLAPPNPPVQPPLGPGMTDIGLAFMVLVLGPIAFAMAWRIIRRGGAPAVSKRELIETNDRLRRIEEAVDAIAIEMERVSEGQRFLTRALAEDVKPLAAPAEKQFSVRGESR